MRHYEIDCLYIDILQTGALYCLVNLDTAFPPTTDGSQDLLFRRFELGREHTVFAQCAS